MSLIDYDKIYNPIRLHMCASIRLSFVRNFYNLWTSAQTISAVIFKYIDILDIIPLDTTRLILQLGNRI
jgi:hypothetical protein